MKRIRPERWRSEISIGIPRVRSSLCLRQERSSRANNNDSRPGQSHLMNHPSNVCPRYLHLVRRPYSTGPTAATQDTVIDDAATWAQLEDLPSPPVSNSLRSSKLSALHARLGLSRSLPLETLARCLVHTTADDNPSFNNSSLALLGADLLGYYTSEHILCNFPRLPMSVLFAAQNAYVGPHALSDIVRNWGVEAVAEPGGEVDSGLLQFRRTPPGRTLPATNGVFEADTTRINKEQAWRLGVKRGVGARIVADDQFGDFGRLLQSRSHLEEMDAKGQSSPIDSNPSSPATTDLETASATFMRALVGAIALHTSRASAKYFHSQHILSRHLDLASLFVFKYPTRDLSRLCAREGFEAPVARLLSETGRHSIAPVFIVGVYSGADKLGEGAGSSLDEARTRAAANALRGWYLYRPLEVTKPSDVEDEKSTNRWIPNHVDCGEVVT